MTGTTLKAMFVAAMLIIAVPKAGWAAEQPSTKEKAALIAKGARLWPIYCNYCHNARPGGQFSPVQWDTIMLHMRVRANLPPEDAKAILEYLKTVR
jgi:mono/diheme cytochrome c family protein